MSEFITGSEGDFFVQPEIALPFEHLTCLSVGDLPRDWGDLTTKYCPDPANKGQFLAAGKIRGEPATNTTTLTRPFSSVANWLLENQCGYNALLTWACQGSRDIPQNFEVAMLLVNVEVATSTLVAPVAMGPDEEDRINTTADIAYDDRLLLYNIEVNQQDISNTAAANGVWYLPFTCETRCSPARDHCEEGYLALDGTLYDSEVKVTTDSGVTWAQTDSDPFEEGGNASDVVVFTTIAGHRVVVSRGNSIAHLPAEVSYSEDWGATWTDVDVGSELGQTIQRLRIIEGQLYAAASEGDIYRSLDQGSTWTRVETGTTTEDLNDIFMYSLTTGYAVGDNNTFLFTTDGVDWNARTGPALLTALLSVTVNTQGHVFVGAADGVLYVSDDAGVTWVVRRDFGAGSIDWVDFESTYLYVGGLIHNTAAPVGTFYRSFDGGATWWAAANQAGAWNAGLNRGFICDINNFVLVGEVFDGTTFIGIVAPTGE